MTRRLASLALAALLLALAPAAAQASRGDRNKDRIPDRWEIAHKLSLKVKQTSKDQDRDGLRNLAEWRNHSDPRDADSDNDGLDDGDEVRVGSKPSDRDSDDDGTRDGDENAGTIQSFTGGVLTIALAGGQTLSATVDPTLTEIECEDGHAPAPAAVSALRNTAGDGEHGDDDDDDGDGEHGDGDGHGGTACTAASLTVGAIVHEADVKTIGGKAVFTEIEVIPAATK